jgi:hypothetical protein
MTGATGASFEAKVTTCLATLSSGLPASKGKGHSPYSHLPGNNPSIAAMMLAADRIAANVLAAKPLLRDALYRKYFGVSEEWLRSHGAAEAEEAQETLDWGEQMAPRLVAMRLANLHETTTNEEQRA